MLFGVNIQIPWKNKTAEANLAGATHPADEVGGGKKEHGAGSGSGSEECGAEGGDGEEVGVDGESGEGECGGADGGGEKVVSGGAKSTTFLLIQRENELANARSAEVRAETEYNKAVAELQRATSTTLRSHNIIIESPLAP